jgi:predicted nucleotidyltransferase
MRGIPGLDEQNLAELALILKPLVGSYKLSLFGSRARGRFRPFSDIDLLVEGPDPVPLGLLARMETDLSESALEVMVELVDARKTSPAFLESIASELITLGV